MIGCKIKWIFEDYSPNEKIDWKEVKEKCCGKYFYKSKLYNNSRNAKNYALKLFLIADEKTEKFTLIIKGNIDKWYSQKPLNRNLTLEEYQNCIKLLLLEIE
jgi:hypothetical protein